MRNGPREDFAEIRRLSFRNDAAGIGKVAEAFDRGDQAAHDQICPVG